MKLHLGCGEKYLHGYLHIDLSDYPHIDYKWRVDSLPMVEDNTVELIYASHVLEYFSDVEAISVLQEWHRVLQPGGILRLAVPDFEALVTVYRTTDIIGLITGPIFGTWKVSPEVTVSHKCLYNKIKLANYLYAAGFRHVREWYPLQVFTDKNDNFDDFSQAYIPHMDKTNGKCISLNLEADK